MRKKSKKQELKDREIGKIKKSLPPFCEICGKYTNGDLERVKSFDEMAAFRYFGI